MLLYGVALKEKLDKIDGIRLQKIDERMNVHPHYMIMFYYDSDKFGGASRLEFVQYLRDSGIPVNRSYEAIHRLPIFKTLDKSKWRVVLTGDNKCINAENISNNVVCLSHNILLGDFELIDQIVEMIRNFN